jgi:hypothetical protein
MIKRFFVCCIICIGIYSCEEDFSPYGEEVNKYVLNCIIRADTNYQTVILNRSYIVDNLDPLSNTNDPNIYNAVVRIYNGDNYALLKDTIINRQSTKYKTPYLIYHTKTLLPDPKAPLEVEAILPSGKAISGTTILPSKPEFYKVESTIPPQKNLDVRFIWNVDSLVSAYLFKLGIYYYKEDETPRKNYIVYIPLKYVNGNGKDYAIYPKVTSENSFYVDMETISKAMQSISDGDPNKNNYVILGGIFEVFALDNNLSSYYNASSRGNDAYSVKLNETDFSEILGGFGVVGSYSRNLWPIKLSHTFIHSFNYKPGLTDVVE